MRELAQAVDPQLIPLTKEQRAAYDLAHALRNSLARSWGLEETIIDNPNP